MSIHGVVTEHAKRGVGPRTKKQRLAIVARREKEEARLRLVGRDDLNARMTEKKPAPAPRGPTPDTAA